MVDPIMPDAYTGMSVGNRAATFCIIAAMPPRSRVAMPAGAEYSSIRPPSAPMRYALKLLLPQLIPMIWSCLASRDTRTSVDRIHRARDPGRAPVVMQRRPTANYTRRVHRTALSRSSLICYGSALLDADPDNLCFTV